MFKNKPVIMLSSTYNLNSGGKIPALGLGTWTLQGSTCTQIVERAFQVGYKHFDTAQMYCNEADVGAALKHYDREKIFVTTKVAPWNQGYEKAYQSTLESLRNLDMEYIDLVLIHWPGVNELPPNSPSQPGVRNDSWRALEKLVEKGCVKNIGVSNFMVRHLESLYEVCSIQPCVNQIEFHPMCHNEEVLEYCKDLGVVVGAYCPLAQRDSYLWNNSAVNELSLKYRKEKAQVLLKWCIQKGVYVIPKTKTFHRLLTNSELDFSLSQSDMERLDSLNCFRRKDWNPNLILY